MQGVGHADDAALGVFGHDVDLPGQLVVVQLQRQVVAFLELQLPVAFQVQGHRRAENGQPLVQAQDVLFVQPEQGAVDEFVDVPGFGGEQGVAGDAGGQFAQRRFSQQIDAARAAGQAGQPVGKQQAGGGAASFGGLVQRRPTAVEGYEHGFRVAAPLERDAAAPVRAVAAIAGQALEDQAKALRQRLAVAFILEPLGEQAQVERVAVAGNRIGRRFTQLGDQRGFQRAG